MQEIKIKRKKDQYSKSIMEKLVGLPCSKCDLLFDDSKQLLAHEYVHRFVGASATSFPMGSTSNVLHTWGSGSMMASGSFSH